MSADIFAGAAVVLSSLGGGIAFVWRKIEKRFAEIEVKLAECEARDDAGRERRGVQLIVIELLWQEIERLAPDGNRVLARAKLLLDDLKMQYRQGLIPLPDDLALLARQIDERTRP